MKLDNKTLGLLFGLVGWPIGALGHHSVIEYDRTAVFEIQGEVTSVSWRNPHVRFEVQEIAGGATRWLVESTTLSHLDRLGVPRDAIDVGDAVTVAGYRSNRTPTKILGTNVLVNDQIEVILSIEGTPRWSGEYVGGGDWTPDAPEGAIEDDRGLFRVWTWDRTQGLSIGRDLPLTEEAATAVAAWDATTIPAVAQCTPAGMPEIVISPFPIEFVEFDDHIELRYEYFDQTRIIHTSQGEPDTREPSPLGYSIGHWEGSTLVVQTNQVSYPFFQRMFGVPQSENVEILERFTVRQALNRLDYEYVVTDESVFTEPFRWEGRWLWRPTVQLRPYNCTEY